MKKLLVLLIFIFLMISLAGCEEKGPYPKGGRDTVEYFGDARFVVLRGTDSVNSPAYWVIYDRKNNEGIDYIDNYKDIKPYVYVIGEKGFTKINYETGVYEQTTDLAKFNDNDKKIFMKLDLEKHKVKKK